MYKENYNVVGVMSGTSLDGVDLAHVRLWNSSGKWQYELLECETIAYSSEWKDTLSTAVALSPGELPALDSKYTSLLGGIISSFIAKHDLTIDAVCSHGHTVLHQPQQGITLQIGNLPQLSEIIQQKVVCNFRVQDVALGGQGAPLVPIGDRLLFSDYDFCLNLGGFSNISFESAEKRLAFDISPVNTVLNFLAGKLGLDYDDRGALSGSGSLHDDLLVELNALPFYRMPFPKSLGIEFVHESVLPLIGSFTCSTEDKLRTFTEHIAMQTALAMPALKGSMLITGGGAYNDFLISRLKNYLPKAELHVPDKLLLEYKEALIFAFLGLLKLRGEINVLSSVTGASLDHSSGMIFS